MLQGLGRPPSAAGASRWRRRRVASLGSSSPQVRTTWLAESSPTGTSGSAGFGMRSSSSSSCGFRGGELGVQLLDLAPGVASRPAGAPRPPGRSGAAPPRMASPIFLDAALRSALRRSDSLEQLAAPSPRARGPHPRPTGPRPCRSPPGGCDPAPRAALPARCSCVDYSLVSLGGRGACLHVELRAPSVAGGERGRCDRGRPSRAGFDRQSDIGSRASRTSTTASGPPARATPLAALRPRSGRGPRHHERRLQAGQQPAGARAVVRPRKAAYRAPKARPTPGPPPRRRGRSASARRRPSRASPPRRPAASAAR